MWADLKPSMQAGAATSHSARCTALKQLHYVAGDNDRGSYVSGFGTNPPKRNHHRNSAVTPWEQRAGKASKCVAAADLIASLGTFLRCLATRGHTLNTIVTLVWDIVARFARSLQQSLVCHDYFVSTRANECKTDAPKRATSGVRTRISYDSLAQLASCRDCRTIVAVCRLWEDVANPNGECPSGFDDASKGICSAAANRPNPFVTHGALIGCALASHVWPVVMRVCFVHVGIVHICIVHVCIVLLCTCAWCVATKPESAHALSCWVQGPEDGHRCRGRQP